MNDVLVGYLQCVLWTENLQDLDAKVAFDQATVDQARKDCAAFEKEAEGKFGSEIADWMPEVDYICGYAAGHNLWLTRNGHGTGFSDRDLGELGDDLTAIAKRMGERWAYIGDDGKVHIS